MKLLKNFTLATLVVLLIAALILLKRCGKDRDTYRAQSDYLRWEAQADDSARLRQEWQYSNDTATYRSEARQQAKKADSIGKIARGQIGEIRQLYALLREPFDTATRIIISERCCDSAVALADAYESLLLVDSLKDGAYMSQIDLATVRIDTLQNQLDRSDRRFWVMDSLNRVVVRQGKVRGSVWVGAGGMIGPVSSAGVYIKYQGERKEYTLGAGMQPGGWYGEFKVGTKISFRKR